MDGREAMMRKAVMILGVLLISSTCVFAMPDRVGKTDAGFHIGGLAPNSNHLDSGAYYEGSVAYGLKDWFALGVETGYEDAGTHFMIGATDHNAKISRIPIFADLIFRHPMADLNTVPYAVLGLGMLYTSIHGTGTLTSANLKLDVSNSLAMKFGLGADWFINDHWSLNFEASYVWTPADARIINLSNGSTVDSANMDYWMIGAGAKYLFD